MRKLLCAMVGTAAVLLVAATAQAAPADQGDLLAQFTTPAAATVAPMSVDQLGAIRGEGIRTFEFLFPHLRHDVDQTFTFDTTTIHVVGDAATGQVSVTVDSPYIQ